jgi:hypothetical protein
MPAYSSLSQGVSRRLPHSAFCLLHWLSHWLRKNYRTNPFWRQPAPAYNAPLLNVTFIEELLPGAKTTLFAFTFPDSTQTIF